MFAYGLARSSPTHSSTYHKHTKQYLTAQHAGYSFTPHKLYFNLKGHGRPNFGIWRCAAPSTFTTALARAFASALARFRVLPIISPWLSINRRRPRTFIFALSASKLLPEASSAAPMARAGAAMMDGKLAAAGLARLACASRCHACRGGLRGHLVTRGIEVRAYATHTLQTDHSSG